MGELLSNVIPMDENKVDAVEATEAPAVSGPSEEATPAVEAE